MKNNVVAIAREATGSKHFRDEPLLAFTVPINST